MAQRLEGIKGGGGSIKLGTTGTISSLMTRELDQISSIPHKQVPSTSRSKPRTLPVSVPCSSTSTIPKRLQVYNQENHQMKPVAAAEAVKVLQTIESLGM